MNDKTKQPASTSGQIKQELPAQKPFTRTNFLLMAGCVALIIIGFILMAGPGSTSGPEGFNPDIFSTRRIVVGPTIAFLGFLLMAFAIIYSPRNKKNTDKHTIKSQTTQA